MILMLRSVVIDIDKLELMKLLAYLSCLLKASSDAKAYGINKKL